jgi:hypothetical protein
LRVPPSHGRHARRTDPHRRRRLRVAGRVCVVATLVTLFLVTSVASPAVNGTRGEGIRAAAPPGQVGKGSRLVFAHYFPPFPISLDNLDPAVDYYSANYLNPDGLNGQYSDIGGMLRDRPLPRAPRPDANWQELDLMQEVTEASEAGIDGFSVDILTPAASRNWVAEVPGMLLRAAQSVDPDFKIMLMPDMHGDLKYLTPAQLADEVADLAASPSAFRLQDGRIVVSPFYAENWPPQTWQLFIDDMKATHGLRVALVPVFLEARDDLIDSFQHISYGMSAWGGRNPAFNPVTGFPLAPIKRARALNQLWMQPVSMQDYRPVQKIYDEAENTTNLRNTWQIAINGDADWVQLITWNDFGEGTAFAPSVQHGRALLELNAYLIAVYKTGQPPPAAADRVFLTHRTQLVGADSYPKQKAVAALRAGSVPGRDSVEATSILTAPATVTIDVGDRQTSCDGEVGLNTCVATIGPLDSTGVEVSVQVSRNGHSVLDFTSPHRITTAPAVQDLTYTMSEAR